MTTTTAPAPKRVTGTDGKHRLVMERVFKATPEEVWELWTTRDGIEAWWGPEGFITRVKTMDLRVGGEMVYDMIAQTEEIKAFMKNAGMPTTTTTRIRFMEVKAPNRLVYDTWTDFIPDHAPYWVSTQVDIVTSGKSTRMTLTIDAMHVEEWTERAAAGWASELGRLEKVLASRGKA